MPDPKNKIRNVILCEDIREEVGNKKSLMGVFAGDVFVNEFPASLQFAIYFEYAVDDSDGNIFAGKFSLLLDDREIASGEINAPIERGRPVTLIIPRGLVQFEKEAAFRMTVAVAGGSDIEVLHKSVTKAPS